MSDAASDNDLSPDDSFLHQSYFGILTKPIIQAFVTSGGNINYAADEDFTFESSLSYDGTIYREDTALSIAFRRNYTKVVKTLLSFGAAIPGEMLCDASMFGNIDIVKAYVKLGGDINYETKLHAHRSNVFKSDTACSIAFRKNYTEIVEYLLHHRAKLPGEMMIELAYQNNIQLIQYGLSIGSDVNHQTQRNDSASDVNNGDTMLIVALKCDHQDLMQVLLNHKGINCNIIGSGGITALHHACITNDVALIESVIRRGADKTVGENKNVKSAFALLNTALKPEIEKIYQLQCCWNRRRIFITVLVENGFLGTKCRPQPHKILNNIDIVRAIVSYI